ncbi:SusC/RagA family TonB-linked outer membrane protein [Sphingobacterium suaedae]|uniref:SusC/RagA family TonB-linked outer membrane protein n=1 Tax=Sphingobacterium suaedae TaxID=1686402 RepID=A0ABW5KMT1_9SPHI
MYLLKFRTTVFCRLLVLLVPLLTGLSVAAQQTLHGQVVDNLGNPVAEATIKVKSSGQSAKADFTGSFSLEVRQLPAVLEVSSVGFLTIDVTVASTGKQTITLTPSDTQLEDVVVVAYGTQKKSTLVGSVAQIGADEIKKAPAMNITNTLAGRIPGLTALQQSGRPGADNASLYVRGIGTYGSNRGPLIIIDNVERPSSTLAYLDPNEIESISVLKDAVATAAYGSRAANGIILVTTRSGKREKTKVSYDYALNVGENTRFPKFLDGPDYMTWYNKGVEVDNDYLLHTNQPQVPLLYSQELIDAVRSGTNTNPLFGNTDWIGMLMDNKSYSQHHSATVSGGSENTQYFAALSHMDQGGVVKNTDFKRYNLRTNLTSKLNDYLTVGLNVGLRNQVSNLPGISPDNTAYMNPFYQAVRMLPNLPMYAENGLPVSYQSNAGYVNPIAAVERSGFQKYNTNVFQGQANVDFYVPGVQGLMAKVVGAYDYNAQDYKTWITPYETMGRAREQISGDFVHLTNVPGITKKTLRQGFSKNDRKTLQTSLNYARTFDAHTVGGLVLYEYSRTTGSLFAAGASNFPIDIIKDIDFGSRAEEDIIAATGSTSAENARAGVLARFNYAYKETYLLEMVSRWDASVNFKRENRWKAFPAIGLGWVVSNEEFFKEHMAGIDYFKVKASLGQSGNDRANEGTFPYMTTFSQNANPVVVIDGVPVSAIYTNPLQNPDLKWETSTTTNVGFESTFLNGKFGVDFEWFYRYTKDILGTVANLYPPSIGGYYPGLANIGEADNRGFDAQIRYRETFGDFRIGVTGNINWSTNRYLKLDEADGIPSWQSLIGKPIGTKIGFIADGMVQSWEEAANTPSPSSGIVAPGFFKYRDVNGDGKITRTEDMTYIGRANVPELMYGLAIDLAYKGFDFSALLQGAGRSAVSLAGTYEGSSGTSGVDDNTPFTRTFYGYGNSPYFLVENAWRPDNPNADFPRMTSYKATGLSSHNAHINSGWIRKGDYLRVKSIQLGYTLPKSVLSKAKIENIRLHVTGSNLFTFDKLKYLDPEMPNVNNGFYPQQKIYAFGINVTF